ncbi:MAG: HAD family hydrolase [Candidatus Cloacimonadota bacterium]|jgi:phosphoglycolate phosphatase|nr:HAD family hydrolase [Candidatus Cloacimonadota bacterium]NMD13023.1 HAD family hydrolase [Candidatus Cloacimonadota bacterium]OQC09565.1 MAG: Phosphoglycolate phosphatase [Candidatus Cloacimonetes bacterium ADurb.Bin088]
MKKKPKIKAIIFDLDGTLLDSLRDIADSMNNALADSGLPEHPLEAYRDFVGNGLFDLVKKATPASKHKQADQEAIAELFWNHYEKSWFLHTNVYPGILYLIQLCVSRKVKVAILSNKVHYFTKKMIRHYFRGVMINQGKNPFGIYSGEQPDMPKKPDPTRALDLAERLKTKPENIAFLGDSAVDMKTAINAGMVPIGAAWGYRGREELEEAGAYQVFDTPTDLASMIEKSPII